MSDQNKFQIVIHDENNKTIFNNLDNNFKSTVSEKKIEPDGVYDSENKTESDGVFDSNMYNTIKENILKNSYDPINGIYDNFADIVREIRVSNVALLKQVDIMVKEIIDLKKRVANLEHKNQVEKTKIQGVFYNVTQFKI